MNHAKRNPGIPKRPNPQKNAKVVLAVKTRVIVFLAAADVRLSPEETQLLDLTSDPGAPDYPYGEPGQIQRSRRIEGGRF